MAAELKITIDDSGAGAGAAPPERYDDYGMPVPPTPPAPAPPVPVPPAPASPAGEVDIMPVFVTGPDPLRVQVVGGRGEGGRSATPAPGREHRPGERTGTGFAAVAALGASARSGGQIGTSIARNENVQGFSAALGAATTGLSMLGPYGMAASVALQAAGASVTAFTNTVNAFVARGRELAGLNGPLAGASAQADITRFRADKREADTLGPQLARLIENQAKADAVFREIMLPIKELLLGKLNVAIDSGLNALVGILQGIQNIVSKTPGLADEAASLKKLIKEIRDILKGVGPASPIEDWLKALQGFGGPPGLPPAPGLGALGPFIG